MRDYADVETASAEYAERFSGATGRWMLDVQGAAVRAALAGLAPGTRVLEVGGGHAQLLPLYGELGLDPVVAGSGRDPGPLLAPFLETGSASRVQADLLDLPFDDRSFPVVVSIRLLPHVERWDRLIGELCRVSAARVVIDYPSMRSVNRLAGAGFGWKRRIEGNTRPYNIFRDATIASALAHGGFDVVSRTRQFLCPMAMHRLLAAPALSRRVEAAGRGLGLTDRYGSPVVLRADRRPAGGS